MDGMISSQEAEMKFGELLKRVESGEEVLITRHELPVARILPTAKPSKEQLSSLFDEISESRKARALNQPGEDPIRISDLINAGRK
ncbi:MAG: type II toxin-antitoxin system prevent-host-death family antitoxin [Verrucomicrobiota bacterium]